MKKDYEIIKEDDFFSNLKTGSRNNHLDQKHCDDARKTEKRLAEVKSSISECNRLLNEMSPGAGQRGLFEYFLNVIVPGQVAAPVPYYGVCPNIGLAVSYKNRLYNDCHRCPYYRWCLLPNKFFALSRASLIGFVSQQLKMPLSKALCTELRKLYDRLIHYYSSLPFNDYYGKLAYIYNNLPDIFDQCGLKILLLLLDVTSFSPEQKSKEKAPLLESVAFYNKTAYFMIVNSIPVMLWSGEYRYVINDNLGERLDIDKSLIPEFNDILSVLNKYLKRYLKPLSFPGFASPCLCYVSTVQNPTLLTLDKETRTFSKSTIYGPCNITEDWSVTFHEKRFAFLRCKVDKAAFAKEMYGIFRGNMPLFKRFARLHASISAYGIKKEPRLNVLCFSNDVGLSKAMNALFPESGKVFIRKAKLSDITKYKVFREMTSNMIAYGYAYIAQYNFSLTDSQMDVLVKMLKGRNVRYCKTTLRNVFPIIAFSHNPDIHKQLPEQYVDFFDMREVVLPQYAIETASRFLLCAYALSLLLPGKRPTPGKIVREFVADCFCDKEEAKKRHKKFDDKIIHNHPSTPGEQVKKRFEQYCSIRYPSLEMNMITGGKKNFIIDTLKEKYAYRRPHYSRDEKNTWEFIDLIEDFDKIDQIKPPNNPSERTVWTEEDFTAEIVSALDVLPDNFLD